MIYQTGRKELTNPIEHSKGRYNLAREKIKRSISKFGLHQLKIVCSSQSQDILKTLKMLPFKSFCPILACTTPMVDDKIDDEKESTLSAGHFDRHGGAPVRYKVYCPM